jgi:hypothetical protein
MTKVCDNNAVDVIVDDDAGRFRMFRRPTPPVGIAPVAGHIETTAGRGRRPRAAASAARTPSR